MQEHQSEIKTVSNQLNQDISQYVYPNYDNTALDDMIQNWDGLENKEDCEKSDFYKKLSKLNKRAKSFKKMFLDNKPRYIKKIIPRKPPGHMVKR
jgi:hypothetical protein